MLSDDVVRVLVCPKSKEPLVYFPRADDDRDEREAFLLCAASRLRYPVLDGVPVMLVDEATQLTGPAVDALLARARILGLA